MGQSSFAGFALCIGLVAACGSDGKDTTDLFPESYASSYSMVRECRRSGDHDLNYVTVWADPTSASTYTGRDKDFPVGSVVVKAEYEFGDETCAGDIQFWTVMVKLPAGSSTSTLDWHWQKVLADRTIDTDDEPRCISCHTSCGKPPEGYQGTCSAPGTDGTLFH